MFQVTVNLYEGISICTPLYDYSLCIAVQTLFLFHICLGKQRPYNFHGQFMRPQAGLQNVLVNGQACHMLVSVCLLGINLNTYGKP